MPYLWGNMQFPIVVPPLFPLVSIWGWRKYMYYKKLSKLWVLNNRKKNEAEMRWLFLFIYLFWCSLDRAVMHFKDLLTPSQLLILNFFSLCDSLLYKFKTPDEQLATVQRSLRNTYWKKGEKPEYNCSTLCFQIWFRLRTVTIWCTSVSLVLWNWFIIDRCSHDISHYWDCHIHWYSEKTRCVRSI